MVTQKFNLILVLALVIGVSLLTRECFPRIEHNDRIVPRIVTFHDTIQTFTRPDTVKIATTDTINLIIRETFHDTVVVNVGTLDTTRDNLYPVTSIRLPTSFGDTGSIVSFSLRTGKPTTTSIFVPGILTSLDVVRDSASPRMNFEPFPVYTVSFWDKLKYGFYGFVLVSGTLAGIALSTSIF